jgi:RHS repeat-associated protein
VTLTVTLDDGTPGPVDPAQVTVGTPSGGLSAVTGAAGCVAPVQAGWKVVVTDLLTGASVEVPAGADGGFAASVAAQGNDTLSIAVRSAAGRLGPARTFAVPGTPQLPADPASIAPPLDRTVATDVCTATAFLYSGANPIQTGVAADAVDCRRVAVLRGRVLDRDGAPLSAVRVGVLRHPELGSTLTRADGTWDLAANGGGEVIVQLAKPGYLAAQRKVKAGWKVWATVPDVVLVPLDPQATAIDLTASAPVQVARGSAVSDGDGSRRATLLFTQGIQASLVFPGGAVQPLQSLTVRATEYTVGAAGPQAMPGELPPTTGYTYAVELSADEAAAAGASEVRFDRPVPVYLENFLGFPAGTVVPVGYYDRNLVAWIAAGLDGRVVQVLSVTAGAVDLDVDGSGQAATATALAALGVTDAERQQLATLYTPGQSLWRVPVTHFTPYDYNWVVQPMLPGARAPKETPPKGGDQDKKDDPCLCSGSILEAENQILGEVIGVAGTPFTLNYRSDRVPGRTIADTLDIPLSASGTPDGLKRIDLEVDVAGQHFTQSFTPSAGQSFSFAWDGKDAYGRAVQGRQQYTARVGYVYDGQYRNPQPGCSNCFNGPGASPLPGTTRQEVTDWQTHQGTLGSWDSRAQLYLGAWSLSAHHAFDPVDKVLYYGDGRRRNAADAKVLKTIAGNSSDESSGDGGPADEAGVPSPTSVVSEPDGTLDIVANGSAQVRAVEPDGTIFTKAGMPRVTDPSADPGPRGDGGPAQLAHLWNPVSLAYGPDGLLYIADRGDERIVRIEADGTLTNVVSRSTDLPAGALPPLIPYDVPWTLNEIDFGPDGKLYVAAGASTPQVGTLHRFDLTWMTGKLLMEGRLEADAHNQLYWNENWQTQTIGRIFTFSEISSLAFDSGGDLYFSLAGIGVCPTIWHRTYDGTSTLVAGSFDGTTCAGYSGDEGPANQAKLASPRGLVYRQDGSLLFADTDNHVVRWVTWDHGQIYTVAGLGTPGDNGPGRPAQQTELDQPYAVAQSPDHDLIIADANNVVRGDESVFPSPQTGSVELSEQIRVTSDDGAAVYVFDASGRHLWTEDARTGVKLLSFAYDDHDRLVSMTDAFANVTTVERDATGQATAIVAPFGQRTTLGFDANGYLASVTNPASERVDLTSTTDGLLQTLEDPKRRTYRYTFDALGRLLKDEDPLHGFSALARTEGTTGPTVTRSSQMGRTTAYLTEALEAGGTRTTVTAPDGTVSTTLVGADGTRTETSADGTLATSLREPDAQLGMQAPVETSVSVHTPSGLASTTASARTIALVDPAGDPKDPRNLLSITEAATVNGRTMTSVRDFVHNLLTVTTSGGRQSVTQLDAFGRVTESRPPGMLPIDTGYDPQGRVSTVTQGDRHISYTYDAQGHVQSVADALGQPVSYTYDLAGRTKTQTLPDGRIVQFDYDANGNLTAITPPGRPAHDFDHNEVDLGTQYTPPDIGAGTNVTTASYNLDRQLTAITRPDGQAIQYTYDPPSGRLTTVTVPQGTYTYTYQAGTGHLASVSDPDGGALAFTYDGSLLTGTTCSGAVSGSIGLTYNNNFELTRRTVDGANPVDFTYDGEGLLQQAGALTLSRNAQTGLVSGTTLGNATDATTYNSFGEAQGYTARYGSTGLFGETFTRDGRGRILEKVETIGGASSTYDYTYDPAGRLTDVKKDNVSFEHYDYDANSNRTAWTDPVGSGTATYDDQDRLLTYGGNSYTYSANGELATKSGNGQTIHYTYDVAGNLRTVLFPDSLQIDYVIDAANRRVGKKVNGVLVQGYLYKDGLSPVAKLDGAGNVTTIFVYGSRLTVPAYMVQGGVTYRLFTDHLGSVRLVVSTADGSIAQRIEYDAFGRVILDTNPGFQPFGFTGGLYDSQTGLIRFGARDYDPETGRWTSKDSAGFSGGDTNLYGYVVNDPVNNFDPNGLYSAEDFLQDAGNLAAGFADTITLGGTRKIRQWMGTDNTIQQCSGAYRTGQVGGAVWTGFAAGAAVEALVGAVATEGGVTEEGIQLIERHLSRPELEGAIDDPPNAAMIQRLRAGSTDPQDLNFYEHEIYESGLMDQGTDTRAAHLQTLEWQGIPYEAGYESRLYHPSVITSFPEYFHPAALP